MPLPDLSRYEKFETLTQGRVRYFESGEGPNLLLIHGMGVYTSADTFQFIFEPLAKHYHVIALDCFGFGKSDRVLGNGPTFDVIVDGIREFMDVKGIDQTHVVGHSAGGWFSGLLTYESPNRVDKLIWIGAAGLNIVPIAGVATYKEPTVKSLTANNMTGVYDGSKLTAELAAEMGEQMLQLVKIPGAFDGLKPLVAQMQNPDTRKSYLLQRRLPHIHHQMLTIWGEREQMEPYPTWTEEWESTDHNPGRGSKPWVAPNMRFEIIAGGTHNVHWEQPEKVFDLILNFLRDNN